MKKTSIICTTLILVSCIFLYGCGHTHEWTEATCTTPKTCKTCGAIEEEALGHSWTEATCTSPKTCSRCGTKDGKALGHDWTEATCTELATCKLCGATKGQKLNHKRVEATCTEPQKCSVCGTTFGDPLGHKSSASSCTEAGKCIRCGIDMPAQEHEWIEATCSEPKTCSRCGATKGKPIDHIASEPKIEYQKKTTCTEDGVYDEIIYCSLCHEVISKETHTEPAFGNHIVVNGKCSRCGVTVDNYGVGTVFKQGNSYIGLQYVKRMSYLPTALDKEEVSSDSEVILGFFEFDNASSGEISIDTNDITCYADGVQVTNVETYIKVKADGVYQYHNVTLDPECRLITCQDFEVPKDWKELTFFYSSDCKWTVKKDDVSKEKYTSQVLIPSSQSQKATNVDEIIYSKDYQIQFKGHQLYHDKDSWSDYYYIVFKFQVTNTSDTELDTGLMGYEMRGYQNGTLLDDGASYALNDKIDGYINIYDVESIAPGMSSNIYIAFEANKKKSDWYLIYDDGYITSHYCGSVFVSDSGD